MKAKKERRCLNCGKIIKDDPRDKVHNPSEIKVCIECTIKLIGKLTQPPRIEILTEEEKCFISDLYMNKQLSGKQIVAGFNEKFGWIPSASNINKYKLYIQKIEIESNIKKKISSRKREK